MARSARPPTAQDPAGALGNQADTWLTLGEASTLLGVHVSTLRRWSDTGFVDSLRTPGGHRRFSRRAMLRLAEGRPEPGRAANPPEKEPWHAAFAAAGLVAPLRVIGQRLAGVLVQFLLGTDPPRHMAEARTIGREYAVAYRASGLTTSEAVQAFLYYRDRFTDALGPAGDSEEGLLERHRRYDAFVGEVLLGLVDEPAGSALNAQPPSDRGRSAAAPTPNRRRQRG